MSQNELIHEPIWVKKTIISLVSAVLWLVSAILALLSIFALREVVIWVVTSLAVDPDQGYSYRADGIIRLSSQCSAVLLGMLSIGVIILSSEYLFRRASEPRTVRILTWLVAAECAIVVPVGLLFWW